MVPEKPQTKKNRFFWARPLLFVLSLVFILMAAREMAVRWDGQSVHIAPAWCLLAFGFSCLAMVMQYGAFWSLVRGWVNVRMPVRPSFRLYLDSQLARYTPGKIGLMAVRISGAAKVGVTPRVMTATLLTELLSWCAWGSVIGMVQLAVQSERGTVLSRLSTVTIALSALALCGVAVLSFVDRRFLPRLLAEKLGALGQGPLIPRSVALAHCSHFVMQSACAACLVFATGGSAQAAVLLAAILPIAIVAGFLALFAPAGVGVREALIVFFAEPLVGASTAVALSILTRAISLASDIFVWAAARFLDARAPSGRQPGL